MIRKLTILVIISLSTSMICLVGSAVFANFCLMFPFDAMVNVFCVWLMFSFGDAVWNRMLAVCSGKTCFDRKTDQSSVSMATREPTQSVSVASSSQALPSDVIEHHQRVPSASVTSNSQAAPPNGSSAMPTIIECTA